MTPIPADEAADATITLYAAELREVDATIAFLCELICRVGGTVVPSLHVAGNWCWRDDDEEHLLAILSASEAAQLSHILEGEIP